MARSLTVHVPDGWCHVMSRGSGGDAICRTDLGKALVLAEYPRSPWRVCAELEAAPGRLRRDRIQSGFWGDQSPAGCVGGVCGDADSPGRLSTLVLRFWTG